MSTTVSTVTARKRHPCDGHRCQSWIEPGHDYARYVAFPGDDANQGHWPLVLRCCASCQAAYDQPMPPRARGRTRPRRPKP